MNEDENEVIKATADAALRPFANLIEKLFGGSAVGNLDFPDLLLTQEVPPKPWWG